MSKFNTMGTPNTHIDTKKPLRQQQGGIFLSSNVLCNQGSRQGTAPRMQLAALKTISKHFFVLHHPE